MPSSNDSPKLTDADWKLLTERADRFAESLHNGTVSDWNDYLGGLTDSVRRAVVREMVKIDLDFRWNHGEKPLLEEYTTRQPDLGPTHALPVDLVCEEYRIRRKRGDNPDIDDYRERFPAQFESVQKELENELPHTQRATPEDRGSVRMGTVVSSPSELLQQVARAGPRPTSTHEPEHFEKTEMLGHGNFGEVWKAKAPGGIEIAIKIVTQPIDRDAAQRELSALELVKNLRHPCLLSTHRFWIDNNRLHIAMELADGSLRDRLKQCKKMSLPGIPRDELLMYFADAAEGLDFLHLRKVFHRDIKPDNIMLLHGHAKVADFGLARLQEQQMMSVSFAGTPVYMAPEAWGGKGGPNSDQYSLAFAYAELRQGKRPIEGNDFTEVMSKTLEGEPDLVGVPPEEAKILKRALSKKPEERYASCSEFVTALAKAAGTPMRIRTQAEQDLRKMAGDTGLGSATFEEKYSDATTTGGGSTKILLALGLLVLLGGAGLAVWEFGLKGSSSTTGSDTGKKIEPDPNDNKKPIPIEQDPKKVIKPEDPIYLPKGNFAKVLDSGVSAVGSKKVYERIFFTSPNGEKATFILVAPVEQGRPFYMMENKVWNGFFAEFASAIPDAVSKTDWRKDGPSKQPATRISVTEADKFAKWLGGKLPSVKQWDYTAGLGGRAGRDGPSLKENTAAVGRSDPRNIDDPVQDVGPLQIKDLAGNGREWTRDTISMREVPLDGPTANDLVVLRGRNYTLQKPLTYADLEYEKTTPQTQFYLKTSPYTTFRVVIEVPE